MADSTNSTTNTPTPNDNANVNDDSMTPMQRVTVSSL